MCDEIINSLRTSLPKEKYALQEKRKFESWKSQGLTLFVNKQKSAGCHFILYNFAKNKLSAYMNMLLDSLICKAYGFLIKFCRK